MSTDLAVLAEVIPARVDDAAVLLDGPGLAKLALFASGVGPLCEEARALCDVDQSGIIRRPLADDAAEARACELISQGTLALKELEASRKRHVGPLNDQVRTINAVYAAVTDQIEGVAGKRAILERAVLAYRAAKKARLAREAEEAERKKREAAEREAEAMRRAEEAKDAEARRQALADAEAASQEQAVAELSAPMPMTRGIRTDSGRVSERERWVLHGFDPDLVPVAYWRDPAVLEALRKVLQKAVTAGAREIPGCSIGQEDGLTRRPGL